MCWLQYLNTHYMTRIFLSIAIAMTCLTTFSQTTHKSIKYGYTLTIPKGWRLSDNINFKSVDTKIVDGKEKFFSCCRRRI